MVFDTDDREKIDFTQEDGRFVQVISTFSNGVVLKGSGVLIGPNDLLTAAHVLYSHDNGGLAVSVEITPSRFNDYKPFGTTYGDHLYLTEDWTINKSYQYDYGVVSLSSSIGYQTGWLGYGYLNDLSTTADTLMTAYGYASDIESANWLIKTTGTPDAYSENILFFRDDLDAFSGQSGSPVLASSQTEDDVVIGVISHQNYFPNENGVIALTQEAVVNIDSWISLNDENLIQPKSTSFSFEDVQSISLLYTGLLHRTPDEGGLKYWTDQLHNGKEFYNIINGFLISEELNNNSDYIGDNESFVLSLYKNILLREADESGLNYWLNELSNDSSKEKVASGFLESDEYIKAQSLNTYTIWHNWFESFSREINGTSSDEIFKASSSDDYINAGAGDDVIEGLEGNDYIYSNIGNDTISGGSGGDFFIFDLTQYGSDTIIDFDIKNDKIKILSETKNLSLANVQGEDTLVLYEDEDSFIILSGLTKDDYADIIFV